MGIFFGRLRPKRRPGRASSGSARAAVRRRPIVECLEDRLLLTIYTVTNTNDAGTGSFRQAIIDANNNPGLDTIKFNIGGSGPKVIVPNSPLPQITDPLIIDGPSQPGYVDKPIIVLDGINAGANTIGLWFTAGNSAVNGLVIERFTNSAIFLDTKGANLVINCYLGTDVSGTLAMGNGVSGISVNSSNNTLGGTAPQQGNLISANLNYGINFFSGSSGNLVVGNLIGTDITGTKKLGNHYSGIGMYDSAKFIQIGGTTNAARNVISGNGSSNLGDGISIFGTASNITIVGNYIGTDITGAQALGNNVSGVALSTSNNTVGGTLAAAGNVISGNNAYGIDVNTQASGNVIQANAIGTDVTGTKSLPNHFSGIGLDGGAHNNTVGGTIGASRNLISGNGLGSLGDGISIFGGGNNNIVQGNLIGTDVTGSKPLPNNVSGIGIQASNTNNNTIGGSVAAAANIVSGNKGNGISIFAGASGNVVEANDIGSDASGAVAVPNGMAGINVSGGANNNTIAANLVSGNQSYGVVLTDSGTTGNIVFGNTIGLDNSGSKSLANVYSGVGILNGASFNTVGGGNVISANDVYGVILAGSATTANVIQGNFIGTDRSGTQAMGNNDTGVGITQGAFNNLIGGTDPGAGNVISGNTNFGVAIFASANSNTVQDNYIGTDFSGSQPLGNSWGVGLYGGASNNLIGGTDAGEGNVISANGSFGVVIFNADATGNMVAGNFIGIDSSGAQPLGNEDDAVNIQDGASDNTVMLNTIGFDAGDGVHVIQGTGNAIEENSMANDGNLGIELTVGGNNEEPAPEITAASTDGSNVNVTGTLDSLPNTDFILEFFANLSSNGSGNCEGEQFLGAISVTTDGNGHADYDTSFAAAVDSGELVTATATDSANNTSQFSLCFQLAGPLAPVGALGGIASPNSVRAETPLPEAPAVSPALGHALQVDQYFSTHGDAKLSTSPHRASPMVLVPADVLRLDSLLPLV
jgi:titin